MNKLKHLAKHTLCQTLFPNEDKEQWLAYQTLCVKYSSVCCLSVNGFSCDGVADYERGISWQHDKIVDLESKEVILEVNKFHQANTSYIVNTWMKVCGETTKTKKSWLNKIFGG